MPIPSIKRPPPPPRRAPPAAVSLAPEVSVGTYTATHLQLRLGGVAATSQQLIQLKDSVNDIKVALATADNSIQLITKNPALLGSAPGDSTRGGVDIQSLQYASATRAKLAEQEQRQDAHYASLRESANVGQEVQRASNDPTLRRCREAMECQLAATTVPGMRLPQGPGAGRPLPPEQQQALLNPFTTVRRQSKSSALATSSVATSSSNNASTNTAPYCPSAAPSSSMHTASAPPDSYMHSQSPYPSVYGSNNSSAMTSAGRYHPGPTPSAPPAASPSAPPMQQYGTPHAQGGYPPASMYPPTVTPMTVAAGAGGQPVYGGGMGGYYGASPSPAQAQYGQYPPTRMAQGSNRPTYTAL